MNRIRINSHCSRGQVEKSQNQFRLRRILAGGAGRNKPVEKLGKYEALCIM